MVDGEEMATAAGRLVWGMSLLGPVEWSAFGGRGCSVVAEEVEGGVEVKVLLGQGGEVVAGVDGCEQISAEKGPMAPCGVASSALGSSGDGG